MRSDFLAEEISKYSGILELLDSKESDNGDKVTRNEKKKKLAVAKI